MMFSTTIILTAIGLATALAAADWYVWGRTYAADIRGPRTPRPLTATELLDGILARTIRANQAVLPRTVDGAEVAEAQAANADHDGNGFKKVA